MSSRSIEGDNPLYLPQAKIYEGSCALGPVIDLNSAENPARDIAIEIERGGTRAFHGKISTSQMRRNPTELAQWLFRELRFPSGVFLFTGTGIVPPHDFRLTSGDTVKITTDGI